MEKEYQRAENLPELLQETLKTCLKLNGEIKNLEFKVKGKKDEQSPLRDELKAYLIGEGYQGIENGKGKVYLQEGGAVPSFKMVLDELRDELPNPVVEKLEARYQKLITVNKGIRLVVK